MSGDRGFVQTSGERPEVDDAVGRERDDPRVGAERKTKNLSKMARIKIQVENVCGAEPRGRTSPFFSSLS